MKRKGQGAIEYLLIIGAAIIVVAIVIVMLVGIMDSTGDGTGEATGAVDEGIGQLSCDLNAVNCACDSNQDCRSAAGNFFCDGNICLNQELQ